VPLDRLEGAVALRDNVHPIPLVHFGGGRTGPFPAMPRKGTLERAELVGVLLQVNEMEVSVMQLAIACCAEHARKMRELVVALDGSHTVEALGAAGATQRALLELLDACGMLERHAPRPAWDGAAQLTWLAHAGILYEASGKRILIDPVAHPRSVPTRHDVRPLDLRDLGPIDAVLITHGDNDHFHPPLLYRLPRTTPVVIPRAGAPQPYHVDMKRVLEVLGFDRIVEIDEWGREAFGDVVVVATPFRGEDWGLELPCRTYVVAGPELTIYANADSTATPEAYARIAKEHRVDVAFVGVTGAAETHVMPPPFGYGNFYVRWLPSQRRNEWVELCNGPPEAAEAARAIGARFAVGYAAGGAAFYALQYTDRGSHAEIAEILAKTPGGPVPLAMRVGVPTRVPPR
jgi:L-ascorbate metabolism protein UlaG (beta-lactamase superfamily)